MGWVQCFWRIGWSLLPYNATPELAWSPSQQLQHVKFKTARYFFVLCQNQALRKTQYFGSECNLNSHASLGSAWRSVLSQSQELWLQAACQKFTQESQGQLTKLSSRRAFGARLKAALAALVHRRFKSSTISVLRVFFAFCHRQNLSVSLVFLCIAAGVLALCFCPTLPRQPKQFSLSQHWVGCIAPADQVRFLFATVLQRQFQLDHLLSSAWR